MSDDNKDSGTKKLGDKAESKGLQKSASPNSKIPVKVNKNSAVTEFEKTRDKAKLPPESNSKEEKSNTPSDMFSAKPMPKMKANSNRKKWILPTLLTLLLIVSILISAWLAIQQYQYNLSQENFQTQIEQQISRQNETVQQAQNLSQSSIQATNQNQLQLNQFVLKNKQLSESLLSTQERIKELSGRQKEDWMLAEVAYLIKISQLQLSLQKDRKTAIQLLKTADSRLIAMADHALLPLREAIARDLSDLSLIIDTDTSGISFELNAIGLKIPSLNLIALEFEPLETQFQIKESNDQAFDLKRIYQDFLKDFVTIKDHSEPVKPLMTIDQRVNLNSNIQLALQQAQIALLRRNEDLYRLNIDNASNWIKQFFKQDEIAKRVTAHLAEIRNVPVDVRYPSHLHSQKALTEISQNQVYRWLENSIKSTSVPMIKEILSKTMSQNNGAEIGKTESRKEEPQKKIDEEIRSSLDQSKTKIKEEPSVTNLDGVEETKSIEGEDSNPLSDANLLMINLENSYCAIRGAIS